MGVLNLVKLVKLYKEILSSYITEDGILITTDEMEDKDILDSLVIKDYLVKVIKTIEEDYIDKGTISLVGDKVDELKSKIFTDEDFIEHPCLFKKRYALYMKIIQLMDKK